MKWELLLNNMKILFFYQYMPNYNFDHPLHTSLIAYMSKIEGIEVKCYGYRMEEILPLLCVYPYNAGITMEQLYQKFPFDAVILMTKSRMFLNYLPKYAMGNTRGEIKEGFWLPRDFCSFNKSIKTVLEEDAHYEADDSWYKELGIKFVLQRHYVNVEFMNSFNSGVKHIFFPFSVDTNLFRDTGQPRQNLITYVGSVNNMYYVDRTKAVAVLKEVRMITQDSPKRKEDQEYVKDLNSFVSHLSGQSAYYILPAKIYEIAASGSLLFTSANPKTGMDLVFPPDTYVKFEDDCSDIISKASFILTERDQVKEIVSRARKHVLENHTHEIRTKQLVEILNDNK